MPNTWTTTTLSVIADALQVFMELRRKRWLCRGHAKCYDRLTPSIDRDTLRNSSRAEKRDQSIELFRSTARFFADGEQSAMKND